MSEGIVGAAAFLPPKDLLLTLDESSFLGGRNDKLLMVNKSSFLAVKNDKLLMFNKGLSWPLGMTALLQHPSARYALVCHLRGTESRAWAFRYPQSALLASLDWGY